MLTARAVAHPDRMAWRNRPLPARAGMGWADATLLLDSPGRWRSQACYAFMVYGRVVYVGSTSDLGARLYKHKNDLIARINADYGPDVDVRLKVNIGSRFGDWAMREIRMIRRLEPRYNMKAR